uniref:Uncharacterized protein n=1 Tax=Arundo donax TaxID=35708 RepID=A0A0A8YTX3_ARUDO
MRRAGGCTCMAPGARQQSDEENGMDHEPCRKLHCASRL